MNVTKEMIEAGVAASEFEIHTRTVYRIITAALAAMPGPVKVKPLDFGTALRHAFMTGAGYGDFDKISDNDQDRWLKYDPSAPCFKRIEEALSALTPAPDLQAEIHGDDLAVDRFATAMKAKLAKKRDEGRGGWNDPEQCHIDYLVSLLMQQIHERSVLDPVDIANISMMIHERGEVPNYGR